MGLYTKTDKQIDNFYEVVSINKSLSKQNFHLKISVLLFLIFIVFLIMKIFHYL